MRNSALPLGCLVILLGLSACRREAAVQAVHPSEVVSGDQVMLEIRGQGFQEGSRVWVGNQECPRVVFAGSDKLVAQIPAELPSGLLPVRVQVPGGKPAILASGVRVNPGPVIPQPAPVTGAETGAILPFQNVATERGIGEFIENEHSVAVADINNDDILDLAIAGSYQVRLYLGLGGGGFQDITEAAGLKNQSAYAVYFADYDNDGRVDILLTGGSVKLFRNLGEARFEEVTEQVGIKKGEYLISAAWCDVNRDGWLDLYLGAVRSNDRLYLNRNGKFEVMESEVFDKETLAKELNNDQPTTFSVACADYDRDGYPDLYVGVRGQPSMLLHNQAGQGFKNVIEEAGIQIHLSGSANRPVFTMDWGVTWADYNNDGLLDLFTTSGPGGIDFYQNQGGGRFQDVLAKSRIPYYNSSLCPTWGDFNNDGLLDLAISDNLRGVFLYVNAGDGSFLDVSSALGLQGVRINPHGMVFADLNQDGALDLVVVNFLGQNLMLMNQPYPGRHYLKVKLIGSSSNRSGIGAVVSLECGDTVMTRQVSAGEGYLSQPPSVLHFGLGSKTRVDRVRVTWPSGELQTLEAVKADQLITITEPGGNKPSPEPRALEPASGNSAGAAEPAPGADAPAPQ